MNAILPRRDVCVRMAAHAGDAHRIGRWLQRAETLLHQAREFRRDGVVRMP
jgi:hypothetical protein